MFWTCLGEFVTSWLFLAFELVKLLALGWDQNGSNQFVSGALGIGKLLLPCESHCSPKVRFALRGRTSCCLRQPCRASAFWARCQCRGRSISKASLTRKMNSLSGWWFGCHFYFSIYWECHHPNWLSYFSEGWPNHQPVIDMETNIAMEAPWRSQFDDKSL